MQERIEKGAHRVSSTSSVWTSTAKSCRRQCYWITSCHTGLVSTVCTAVSTTVAVVADRAIPQDLCTVGRCTDVASAAAGTRETTDGLHARGIPSATTSIASGYFMVTEVNFGPSTGSQICSNHCEIVRWYDARRCLQRRTDCNERII